VQLYNSDRPEGRMNLGNLKAQRGDAAGAQVEYRRAIAIDPTFEAAYNNLADTLRAGGAEAEAEATLREGLRRNPGSAVLNYSLGLSLTRAKRRPESLQAFAAARKLAPQNARFAYVHAVALNDAGQPGEALKALRSALAKNPNDRDLLSGLAYFTAQGGDRAGALVYATRLRELDPESAEFAQMERQLK
jgi:predicted Zn-dependent protease